MYTSPITGNPINESSARSYYRRIMEQLDQDPERGYLYLGSSVVSAVNAIAWAGDVTGQLFPQVENTPETNAEPAREAQPRVICENCREEKDHLIDIINTREPSRAMRICEVCLSGSRGIIGFNYIIEKYQFTYTGNDAIKLLDPMGTQDSTVLAIHPDFFPHIAARLEQINAERPRIARIVIIQGKTPQGEEIETAMPQYNTMTREGSCIYLCGGNAGRSRESSSCAKCSPITWCDECISQGRPSCMRCLRREAAYIEKDQTTLRPQRIYPNNYHSGHHAGFKAKKYRLKDERPYLYYGIEIEVELPSSIDRERFAEHICLAAKGIFVAERDGSLSNGVEFISRPISYLAWKSQEIQDILKEVFNQFAAFGVYAVNQKRSGMHVHMSKMFFQKSKAKTVQQQKEDMAWIFEFYDREIAVLSRRQLNQYCRSRRMVTENQMKDMRIMSKNYSILIEKEGPVVSHGSGDTHHHMVSETRQTLEVRTFSTPKTLLHVMAAIEICRNLAHYARNYPLKGVNLGQIMHSKPSPFLDEYIKELKFDLYATPVVQNHIKVSKNKEVVAIEEEEDYYDEEEEGF